MMRAGFIIVALAALSGCSEKTAKPQEEVSGAGKTYFQAEIAPVLQSSCASCHLTGEESGGLSLLPRNAVGMLVDVSSIEAPKLMRVVAGKPDESYLIMKLEGTHVQKGGSGAQMPFGAAPLKPEQIAKFRKWISEGAKP